MKRVLVTGARGCIGRGAVPLLLADGWEVHAVASGRQPDSVPGASTHVVDLLNATAVAALVRTVEPSHLLHLAWSITPGKWASAVENLSWVEASINLARCFAEAGGQRFVGAGSCLEYDWAYGYLTETLTPRAPHTLYGTCKNAVYELLAAFGPIAGLSVAWGRIFFLYGPHEHPDRLVASVIRSLVAGEPARCSHGNQIRDYLYAADVAAALVHLLESDATGAVNIGSGQPIALKDLVMRIGRAVDRVDLIQLGAIPAAPTDTPLVVANVERLRDELRWRPRYSLNEGLAETVAWWRDRAAPGPLTHPRT